LPPNAIVVLITIDALRAEAVNDATNDARFPTLAKLKHEGVVFTHASAPGTQTGVSLSTMYSGLYYSERPWENYGVGKNRHPYPASSSAPHFPELLAEHGVATANFASLPFLGGDYGVTGHFADEKDLGQSTAGALGPMLVANMVERLRHADEAPLFLVTHLLEPHAPPFTLIHDRSAEYARYLSQIAAADRAMSRLLPLLEQRFGDRWAVLVSADHGEAFDEHGTYDHSKTLYEELLHVPLLAMSPHFSARTIEAPVGLIDLGPTILDLFGVDTPATFNGQSLVPLLAGGAEALTRPLLAEGRLRRAITEPDGLKVIEDLRRKVVEVYDLKVDPGETENLFDREPDRADAALAELRAFFAVHAYTKDGYEPRYKL
jgi:arylsulfatase A-like enzyme